MHISNLIYSFNSHTQHKVLYEP